MEFTYLLNQVQQTARGLAPRHANKDRLPISDQLGLTNGCPEFVGDIHHETLPVQMMRVTLHSTFCKLLINIFSWVRTVHMHIHAV